MCLHVARDYFQDCLVKDLLSLQSPDYNLFSLGPWMYGSNNAYSVPKGISFSFLYERQRIQPSLSAHQTPISKEKMYVASKNLAFLLLVLFPFFISIQPCTIFLLIFYCFPHLWLIGNAMNSFAKVQTLRPQEKHGKKPLLLLSDSEDKPRMKQYT